MLNVSTIITQLNASQARGLTYARNLHNTENGTSLSEHDYLASRLEAILANWDKQCQDMNCEPITEALPTATDSQISQIKTILGIA